MTWPAVQVHLQTSVFKIPRRRELFFFKKIDARLLDFVQFMLVQDRFKRPSIHDVVNKLDVLLKNVGGTWRWRGYADESDEKAKDDANDESQAFVQFV